MQFRKPAKSDSAIELMPLIDMVFILLVFFMLSASFLKPVLQVDLPDASATAAALTDTTIRISIDANNTLYMNRTRYTLDALRRAIHDAKARTPKLAVVLSAHEGIRYGLFVQVMGLLKELNITTIGLEHDDQK